VKPIVCSLSSQVPLARYLPGNREDLSIVEKRGKYDFTTVFRVARLLRKHQVDVVHAFCLMRKLWRGWRRELRVCR